MTAWLIVGGALAFLVAYFAVGWMLAVRDLPRIWERSRQRWTVESIVRSEVNAGTTMTLFFWPVRLPFIRVAKFADRFDPKRIEAERREQDQRIADLERELRIGRRS